MQPAASQSLQILARAVAAHQGGNLAQAEFLYKLVLQADKKQFDALHMLGILEAQRGDFATALRRLQDALRVRPKSVDVMINLGRVQSELGDDANAAKTYQRALTIDPRSALAHSNLSIVLRQLGRNDEALEHADAALAIAPDYAEALNNRGSAMLELERSDEALESYNRALALQPRLIEAVGGRGNALAALHRFPEALADYQAALAAKPDNPGCLMGRGYVLGKLQRYDQAIASIDQALALKPDYPECLVARGELMTELRRFDEALDAYEKAFRLDPELPLVEGLRLSSRMATCTWQGFDVDSASLLARVRQGQAVTEPFLLFGLTDAPADLLIAARSYVAKRTTPSMQAVPQAGPYNHDRIRLAYISADFRNHPVALLSAGLFGNHDRTRFETTAISIGPDSNDAMRQRLRSAFDRFIDVDDRTDTAVVELLRELEIDIAIDLTGHTKDARLGILARRPAPIQVSYLGFPSTLGASFIDYILTDQTAVPPDQAQNFAEKLAWLPNSYMINDNRREIAEAVPSRAMCGLPEDAFVFCCMNNLAKLNPPTFDIWMRLLSAQPGAVLWLSEGNSASQLNLRREAELRGVAGHRLIFAPRLPSQADHLARHRQADLFLDTMPFNAHTTASDALWAGLPVLTCAGTTFPGRVAASLLHALGLPELVTHSPADYEALAGKIASDPALCAALKAKLRANRDVYPLFDTVRTTRNIEAAFTTMVERAARGEGPESFAVAAAD
jgi:predicted O-linked N-acetylglucosamine transferase (SPINDLY family)